MNIDGYLHRINHVMHCRRVAVCCGELQCAAECCSVLQHVAVCCNVLLTWQRVSISQQSRHAPSQVCCTILQCVAGCCTVLQCIADVAIDEYGHANMVFDEIQRVSASTMHASSTGTHCNTLQHTATHCNTLQHSVKHCNTLQHTET